MRSLIKIVFIFSLFVGESLLAPRRAKVQPECRENLRTKRVVIVGAGMAGLTAASELFWQGFHDVIVLEGNNRIGGRIYTIPQQTGGVLEYGAQWIHGEIGNPLYRMAWNNNLLYEWSDGEERHPPVDFHTIDGQLIPKQVVDRTFQIIDKIFTEAETLIDNLNGIKLVQVISGSSMKKMRVKRQVLNDDRDWFEDFKNVEADKLFASGKVVRVEDSKSCAEISFGAYVRTMFKDHLDRTEPPAHVRHWMEALYGWRMRWENTETSCPSLDDVSFPAWNDYVQPPGEMDVELGPKGYSGLFDVITENIPQSAIRLNTHVEKIQWKNADNTVKIIASGGKTYTADNVIVTSSLGYLKQHHVDLFEPALPLNKTQSISKLGFGTVDKILLMFDEKQESVNMAWHDADNFQPQVNGKNYEKTWYRALYSFNPILQQPAVTLAFIAGDEAMAYETAVSDSETLEVCHQLLKKFSGRQDFPRPNSVLRTSWFSDKYANGSYSYRRVGSSMKDSEVLAEPAFFNQIPVMLFAGEASHPVFYSTATGAYRSGQREAERLTNYYCPGILPEKNKHI